MLNGILVLRRTTIAGSGGLSRNGPIDSCLNGWHIGTENIRRFGLVGKKCNTMEVGFEV